MLCAARAEVGPLGQSLLGALGPRGAAARRPHDLLRPGSREVRLDGPRLEIDSPGLRASLRLGECAPVESICPSRRRGWGWTRKRAGVPIEGTVEVPGQRWEIAAFGVDDESAGYHQRHTSWHWSAGVGMADRRPRARLEPGRGRQRPAERNSERAIWIDGEPTEPAAGLASAAPDGIDLAGGDRLDFATESDHARDENFLLFRSRYRHRFGSLHRLPRPASSSPRASA